MATEQQPQPKELIVNTDTTQPQYDVSGIPTQVAPHYAPQPMPNVIINNSAAASASATSGYGGLPLVRKRQSFTVHFWLFMTTMGVGNYFYARHCRNTVSVRVSH